MKVAREGTQEVLAEAKKAASVTALDANSASLPSAAL